MEDVGTYPISKSTVYNTKLSINLTLITTDDVMSKWNITSSFLLGVFNKDRRMTFSSILGSIKRMHFITDDFLVECFSFS